MRHALRQLGPRARKERFALGLCRLGMRGKVFRLTGAGAGEPRLMRGDASIFSTPSLSGAWTTTVPSRFSSIESVRRRERTSV